MTAPGGPDILYLLSDQHSARVLGCYGEPSVRTPALDALAASGTTLTAAYCPSPICVPSRMSMLTAKHPYQNEVWTNRDVLGSGVPTYLHSLGVAGYDCTHVGNLHSMGPDQLRGYAHRFVGDHRSNHWGASEPPRGVLHGAAGPDPVSLERSGPGLSAYEVHDEDVTSATVELLSQIGARRRAGVPAPPFCIGAGFMLPHPPYVARAEDYAAYEGSVAPPRTHEPFGSHLHPFVLWWRGERGLIDVAPAVVERARTAYWALVTRLDTMIGRVLEALHDNGLAENTLVIYTSDHGDHLGEHGLWWKHTFYEESVRVPAIVSWPGVVPAGAVSARPVSTLDLTATMLDAAAAPPLPGAAGRSLVGLLTAGDATVEWDDTAFSEYCTDQFGQPGGTRMRMVRRGDWKLVHYDGFDPQLFDLAADPDEVHDRAHDPSCASVRDELTDLVLADWDPVRVREQMADNRERADLLGRWAARTAPPEEHVWAMTPDMNRLDRRDVSGSVPGSAVAE